jgi:hypothetical protein
MRSIRPLHLAPGLFALTLAAGLEGACDGSMDGSGPSNTNTSTGCDSEGIDCIDACGDFVVGSCVNGNYECPPQQDVCPDTGTGGADSYGAKWSQGHGEDEYQGGDAVAVGPGGEVIVAATFSGTIDFGGDKLASAAFDDQDIALAKLTPAGEHVWSKSFGGPGNQRPSDMAADAAGNVFLAGSFTNDLDLGAGSLAPGPAFVAKLDPDGALLWAVGLPVGPPHIALDSAGNLLGTAACADGADLGGGPLAGVGLDDLCVFKLDAAAGAHLWSQLLGGPSYDAPLDIAVGPGGEITVCGTFRESMSLPVPLTASGGDDAFILQLDKDGTPLWGRGHGGPGDDGASSVVYGASGPVLTGWIEGTVDLGGGSLGGAGQSGFVLWLDPAGDHRGSVAFGGLGSLPFGNEIWHLALDSGGGEVLAGQFLKELIIGSYKLPTAGDFDNTYDLALLRFTDDGALLSAHRFGDAYDEQANGLAVSPSGDALLTGSYFGAPDLGNGKLPASANGTLFIASFPPE